MMKKNLLLAFLMILEITAVSQNNSSFIFKKVDTTLLKMQVLYPPNFDKTTFYPAIIFFFGGGWNGGTTAQFEPHAQYFTKRGLVCFLADYRVKSRQQTTPFESLKDAKSAIRYIRSHAEEFQINPAAIIASGGSAGGHLAAATALIKNYNEEGEDLSVSCIPDALVLFNPVIDNGPGGYGFERIGTHYKDFSPLHNINAGAPPTIIFLGTKDNLIPVETVEYYRKVMEKVGSRCELRLYEGEGHGFFNYNKFDNYKKTIIESDLFLKSLGYLNELPIIPIE